MAETLTGEGDIHRALERTLELVASLLGLRTGWIWLIDPETQQFYIAASHRLPPYLRAPVRMAGSWCECTDAFRRGELTAKNVDVIECTRLRPAVRRKAIELTQGLRYHATVPLYFRDKSIGVMNLTDPSWRELTREELRVLSTVALQIGAAIERTRLAEERARLARAEERARIAREIHDTIAQGFTAIALRLEGALRHMEGSNERARSHVEQALEVARTSVGEARSSLFDLRSAPLNGRPLVQALGALARSFTSETGIPVRVRESGTGDLSVRAESELYRIAQEALTNVRKHAQAMNVEIALRRSTRAVTLTIRDDGIGISKRPVVRGHGIIGMEERARLLGGRFEASAAPRGGTLVRVYVPVKAPQT